MPVRATRRMQDLVTADHFCVRVREKQKRVALLAAQSLGNAGWIDADRNRKNALSPELGKTLFDAS